MNRFEALHALGLEEGATDEDVRLAYYGIVKAASLFDFSEEEHIARRVEGLLDHAKYSKKFLLSNRSKTAARQVHSEHAPAQEKIAVTPTQEKEARLHGLGRIRTQVMSYLDGERSKRRTSIWVLVGCIVVSFILLRYLRGMPRIVAFAVVGAAAIAGSTVLTTSHMQIRKIMPYVQDIDEKILGLRRELGLEPEEEPAPDASDATADPDAPAAPAETPKLEDPAAQR